MLWANLQLNDNTKAPSRDDPHFDRLFKIRPMLDILQQTFRKAHNPSQQISDGAFQRKVISKAIYAKKTYQEGLQNLVL